MSIHASGSADIDLVIRNYVVGMVSADKSLLGSPPPGLSHHWALPWRSRVAVAG